MESTCCLKWKGSAVSWSWISSTCLTQRHHFLPLFKNMCLISCCALVCEAGDVGGNSPCGQRPVRAPPRPGWMPPNGDMETRSRAQGDGVGDVSSLGSGWCLALSSAPSHPPVSQGQKCTGCFLGAALVDNWRRKCQTGCKTPPGVLIPGHAVVLRGAASPSAWILGQPAAKAGLPLISKFPITYLSSHKD